MIPRRFARVTGRGLRDAAGALVGALTTGWLDRIRRRALAVLLAVGARGAAIAILGLVRALPVALLPGFRRYRRGQ